MPTAATTISTTTIVNRAEEIIREAMENKTLDLTQRAKIVGNMLNTQLKAGALNLGYQRAIARLPEEARNTVPLLNSAVSGGDAAVQ